MASLKQRLKTFLRRHFPAVLRARRRLEAKYYTARARRGRRRCKTYVGITGSCGKSTTTYLTGALLEGEGSTEMGMLRNVPLIVLQRLGDVRRRVDFMVQEISGHKPGSLKRLGGIVEPDIAVVTTVGHDHYTSFRNLVEKGDGETAVSDRYLDAIATEKGRLVSSLRKTGVACLNIDDPRVRNMASIAPGRVIFFGVGEGADVRASNVSAVWPERLSFDLDISGRVRHVETRFVGTLALNSILAAFAVVLAVGGDIDRAVAALSRLEPVDQRMSVHAGKDGHTYIADTRKAPLWQVERLLDDLPQLQARPLVFVLGELSDTRNDKSAHYRKVLRRASGLADRVVGYGPAASNARKVAAQGHGNVSAADSREDALALFAGLPPSVILLKSNKSTKMGAIVTTATGRPFRFKT